MEGGYQEGWYVHPNLGLIKVIFSNKKWVFRCYTDSGSKPLSKERPLDPWTWALSEPQKEAPSKEEA